MERRRLQALINSAASRSASILLVEEDLEDIVLAKNTEIWSELKSQDMDLKIGDT